MATQAKDWKNRANRAAELELPSGNTALVRNPGMQVFLTAGIIPNSLLAIVMEAVQKDEMPALDEMATDPKKLSDVMGLIDEVTVFCVVEPAVTRIPNPGLSRDEDALYVDEVDMEDKLFIFQYAVGGTKDLEQFRNSTRDAMGGVPGGEVLEPEAV